MTLLKCLLCFITFILVLALSHSSLSKPVTYEIDPAHTYPSFEADHLGGLSLWRGKINSTRGFIIIDQKSESGSVEVIMDMDSIDFGLEEMNQKAISDDILDVERFPEALYTGKLVFRDGEPSSVEGSLTLHGTKRPVTLEINGFKCMFHPMRLKRACGADASALIDRADFGIDYGKIFGFKMEVLLRISVEAFRTTKRQDKQLTRKPPTP